MNRWYTTYSGYDWNPSKGYSNLFINYVRSIREWFELDKVKTTPGVEISKGIWKTYHVESRDIMVIMDRFEWMHQASDGNVYFRIHLRVGHRNSPEQVRLRRAPIMNIFFDEDVLILFADSFPYSPPLLQIDSPTYRNCGDAHAHHLFDNGTMCVMADPGDWNPNKDNILRAINVGIDWITWHYFRWGNDPRRWR